MKLVTRRTALIGIVFAVLAAAPSAQAGEIRPWDAALFEEAQAAGRPLIVHVTAPWCPTCHAQIPVIEGLAASPDNPDLLVLDVDFDTRKDLLRAFGVRQQSTLIAYRGGIEVARTVGVTNPDALADFVAQTH